MPGLSPALHEHHKQCTRDDSVAGKRVTGLRIGRLSFRGVAGWWLAERLRATPRRVRRVRKMVDEREWLDARLVARVVLELVRGWVGEHGGGAPWNP